MKKLICLLFISLFVYNTRAQDLELPFKFGDVSLHDLNLKFYDKDSSAVAVVLYEKGLAEMKRVGDYVLLQTTFYSKIKIFNKEGYEHATVTISLYNNKNSKEKVLKIKGITHNIEKGLKTQSFLNKKNIYTTRISEYWTETKFTLPNLKNGSIIEYTYVVQSPFDFNFTGWEFQDDIPKVYSELHALIPGNWVYNKKLIGYKKLDIKKATIKKRCFYIEGFQKEADCEDLTFAMKDIPAFKEEKYLTSRRNYLSRISFELSEYHSFRGEVTKFTKSWKDVDKKFKYDYNIGRQLKRIDYTKKLLPVELLTGTDELTKARKIYHYIQKYFKWNGKYQLFKNVDFKKAFKSKLGNVTEINIALSNALNAAGIKTNIMLLSTRSNGLPTSVHPILSDFNYAIAFAQIGENYYTLDASYKLLPFGVLPFKALNSYGRVMDFKNKSYWQDISSSTNVITTSINLKFEQDVLKGFMRISSTTYSALNRRNYIINKGEEAYKKNFENKSEMSDLLIESYRVKNLNDTDASLIEDFKISLESEMDDEDILIINPFFDKYESNPFKLDERSYPVDFGYPRSENYRLILVVPEFYTISSVPKDIVTQLPEKAAILVSKSTINGQRIIIDFKLRINKTFYLPNEYTALKTFFKSIIDLQNDVIILKKKS